MLPIANLSTRPRALLLLLLALLPAQSPAEALTLAAAEHAAIERDAMLREMRAQGAAMRERAVMDGQLMDPELRLGVVNVPVDSFSLDAEDMTMLELGISQEFRPGKSRQLSRRQMEQLATAMDATALDRERIVRRDVRRLWTRLAYIGSAGRPGELGRAAAAIGARALRRGRRQAD
jgi:hypothetical protein